LPNAGDTDQESLRESEVGFDLGKPPDLDVFVLKYAKSIWLLIDFDEFRTRCPETTPIRQRHQPPALRRHQEKPHPKF
jgi:hypothetical protein